MPQTPDLCCVLTKDFPKHDILISEATLQALSDRDQVETVDLDEVKIKGKTEPVRVFAVLDHHGVQT